MLLKMMPYNFEQQFTSETEIQEVKNEQNEQDFIDTNIILTESQNELVEKFNAAFFEAQNNEKSTYFQAEIVDYFGNILNDDNLEENLQQNDYENLDSPNLSENNFLLDLFFSKNELGIEVDNDSTTDITSSQSSSYNSSQNYFDLNSQNCSKNTETTIQNSNFFVPPPFPQFSTENKDRCEENSISYENFDDLGLSDLEFCENLSNGSFDLETIATELCDDNFDLNYENSSYENFKNLSDKGPGKKLFELDNFLRNSTADNINIFAEDNQQKNPCGHLLGNQPPNNNLQVVETVPQVSINSNQLVLPQQEALILHTDPLLSSSNLVFPNQSRVSEIYSSLETIPNTPSTADDVHAQTQFVWPTTNLVTNERVPRVNSMEIVSRGQESDEEEFQAPRDLICKWEGCWEQHTSQKNLVKHIEKMHVEHKKGEEFSCFWLNCPRKNKPFNARYKLLIHMRVHSGDKPNKCPFSGCNKAFSRLENLKIHQRSHTGERPYLCQFNSCTKSFSNSSDRAKHQRTHFDTKPYACQISGCAKRYTDPSSLRKHVKNHSPSEQAQLKKKQQESRDFPRQNSADSINFSETKQYRKITINSLENSSSDYGRFRKISFSSDDQCSTVDSTVFENNFGNSDISDHSYSTCAQVYEDFVKEHVHRNVKLDLKNKISEKNRQKRLQLVRAESF